MVAVGITGHRNLPAELAEQVSALLRAEIAALDLGPGELVGVTCLADGADTLFAREILAHGGTLEVIVPAEQHRDGLPARGYGGTADVVGEARALQLPVRVVWPVGAVRA